MSMDKDKLIRDDESGAILNTDNKALEAYRKKRDRQKEQDERIARLENGLNEILNILKEKQNRKE